MGGKRAASFDLILFRIPKFSGTTGAPQTWDEGVGFDYNPYGLTSNGVSGGLTVVQQYNDTGFFQQDLLTGIRLQQHRIGQHQEFMTIETVLQVLQDSTTPLLLSWIHNISN